MRGENIKKTETYDYTSIDEAIDRLQKLKAEGKNPKNIVINNEF